MEKIIKKLVERAQDIISNNERIQTLIEESRERLRKIAADSEIRKTFVDQINVLSQMIKGHFSGEYKAFSARTILIFVFGLVYFITPTDLLPDFIPILGFTDDIALLYWIFQSFSEDIEQFKATLPEND